MIAHLTSIYTTSSESVTGLVDTVSAAAILTVLAVGIVTFFNQEYMYSKLLFLKLHMYTVSSFENCFLIFFSFFIFGLYFFSLLLI